MSVFQRIMGMFTRNGRDEATLRRGIRLAQSKKPDAAVEIYDRLINTHGTSEEVRTQAMFNRALAHSMLKHDDQAITDLNSLLAQPRLAENIREAARSQLIRVKKRKEREAS
jgi:hypothetical protein